MEDNFDDLLTHPDVASRWVSVTAELKSLATAFDLDDLSEEDCRAVPEARIFAVSDADFDADKALAELENLDSVKALRLSASGLRQSGRAMKKPSRRSHTCALLRAWLRHGRWGWTANQRSR